MHIRKGLPSDADAVWAMVKETVAFTNENGITHWNEVYPREEIFREDIEKGDLYLMDADGEIAGVIVATDEVDPEYVDFDWEDKDGRPLMLHRLTVNHRFMRRGVGTALYEFARAFAIENGFTSLRFDTFSRNPWSLAMYKKLGFVQRPGEIFFPRENEEPYLCFEVIL